MYGITRFTHQSIFNGLLVLYFNADRVNVGISETGMWWSKKHFQPEGKTALVIGGSLGIGADISLRSYEQGASVIIVARTESKLKAQVERIIKIAGEDENKTADFISCDVSNYEQCESLWHSLIAERHIDPEFIFCCAGASTPKLFGDLTGKDLANGMTLNYSTAINVVHSGFKAVVKQNLQKKRHIILFSSVTASYPFIGYGQYAPAKAALLSLSIILRQELAPYQYRISCVYAGSFISEGYREEEKTKPAITKKIEGPSPAIPSIDCCDIVLDQLAKGYDSVFTDFIGWFLACSLLGTHPRCWGFFQIIVSFIFLVIAPIVNFFTYKDIKAFFEENARKAGELEPR